MTTRFSHSATIKKSTTVRPGEPRPLGDRRPRWLVRRCPRLVAFVLAELCLAPRARRAPLVLPKGVTHTELRVGKRRLRVHVHGEGPLVVLVHGWQGGASQLASLAASVCAAGFRVALFDMPAHGEAPGWSTSAPEFIRILAHVARALGPLHAVVGHRLGGTAALLCAARGLRMAGVVALAPVPSFEFAMGRYARAFGLAPRARELLARRFEARTDMKRGDLDLASVTPGVPTLLVHDLLDRAVPSRYSRQLGKQWPGAHLIETCGFAHGGMLDAERVAQSVVAFLATLPAASEPAAELTARDAVKSTL